MILEALYLHPLKLLTMNTPTLQGINGWLVIDKPSGPTSAKIVSLAKQIPHVRKAGHAGTLDPLATGVLPIALGEATKTIRHVIEGLKQYEFTINWGEERSTDDSEGIVTASTESRPTQQGIECALLTFLGITYQIPPMYSALKVNGQRAYKLARRGQAPELKPREILIRRFSLIDIPNRDSAFFQLQCGKGTYVRALARDLSRHLGTFGYVSSLRRIQTGPFHEKQAISLEKLQRLRHSPCVLKYLLPLRTALADIPALSIDGQSADRLRRGQAVHVSGADGGTAVILASGQPIALASLDSGWVRPKRVFNL